MRAVRRAWAATALLCAACGSAAGPAAEAAREFGLVSIDDQPLPVSFVPSSGLATVSFGVLRLGASSSAALGIQNGADGTGSYRQSGDSIRVSLTASFTGVPTDTFSLSGSLRGAQLELLTPDGFRLGFREQPTRTPSPVTGILVLASVGGQAVPATFADTLAAVEGSAPHTTFVFDTISLRTDRFGSRHQRQVAFRAPLVTGGVADSLAATSEKTAPLYVFDVAGQLLVRSLSTAPGVGFAADQACRVESDALICRTTVFNRTVEMRFVRPGRR